MGHFLRPPLSFFRAHETLQFRLTKRNSAFSPRNLFFNFVPTVLHLLALDRIQALPFELGCLRGGPAVPIPTHSQRHRRKRVHLRYFHRSRRSPLLPPEIVLIISRINLHFAVA